MKKLSIVLLVISVAVLALFGYQHYKLKAPPDILEKLEELRAAFKDVYDEADDAVVVVIDNWYIFPSITDESVAEEALSLMDQIGAYQTIGACGTECSISVEVGKLSWLRWLGPSHYYQYGYVGSIDEEELVDSIDQAVEENSQASTYSYCEKTQAKNWFYCTSNE